MAFKDDHFNVSYIFNQKKVNLFFFPKRYHHAASPVDYLHLQ